MLSDGSNAGPVLDVGLGSETLPQFLYVEEFILQGPARNPGKRETLSVGHVIEPQQGCDLTGLRVQGYSLFLHIFRHQQLLLAHIPFSYLFDNLHSAEPSTPSLRLPV